MSKSMANGLSRPAAAARGKGKSSQYRREQQFVRRSLTPIMLLFMVFSIVPIIWGILLCFYEYSPLKASSPFTGLTNFMNLWNDDVFLKSCWNTFKFVIIAVPLNILITLFMAMGINKIRSIPWRNTIRTLFFLPTIAPLVGSAVVWSTMFDANNGLFNIILEGVGLEKVYWLSDPSIAMLSVIMMTLWADIGFNIVIFMAGLDAIPSVFYEAAELDGARAWQRVRYITLPLLSRTSLFVMVMTVISYFQMFPQFQVMTKGEPQNETRVLALNIYDHAFTYMNMGYASAMAMVLLIVILLITVIQIRLGRSQWEY